MRCLLAAMICSDGAFISRVSGEDRAESSVYQPAGFDPSRGDLTKDQEIRLNFFNASWPKVLNKLAEESDSTLIMQAVPPGRFTRRDRQRYSRSDAVKILNHQLEPEGFRILEKDKYLIVLHLKTMRAKYSRPELPNASEVAPERNQKISERASQTSKQSRATSTVHQIETNPNSKRGKYHLVSGEQPAQNPLDTDIGQQTARDKTVVVKLEQKTAREVAQRVYRAFKPNAELLDEGPRGLPAFRVFHAVTQRSNRPGHQEEGFGATQKSRELFSIGIDTQRQELVVAAPAEVARDLVGLIRALDVRRMNEGETIQIVPAPSKTREIARNLQPSVDRLIAQRRAEEEQVAEGDADDSRDDTDTDDFLEADENDETGSNRTDDVSGLVGGLKGEVRVQSMQDLGVFILEGSDADVALMRQVIREIERLSLGAVPEIRLKPLTHVNSESLAILLNSVYEKLTAQSSQGAAAQQLVNIFPIVKPNSLLVLAPGDDLDAILKLVDQLDLPIDPASEFEVFSLQNAIASQLTAMVEEFYEQRAGLGARVKVVADVRTNSIIAQARPTDLEELRALIRKLDRDDSGSVTRMHVVHLRHSSAEELAAVINQAIASVMNPAMASANNRQTSGSPPRGGNPSGDAAGQLQQPKSVVLEFLSIDGEAKKIIRSGILADIRITADPRINALLITAPEQSMQLMTALVRQLDRPASTVSDIKIFSLVNSDADAMMELLQSIFGLPSRGESSATAVAGFEDVDTSVLPLRFSVENRTNSIVAVGSPGSLRVVEAILLRLDESDIRQRRNTVIRLKNSPAEDVAEAINDFLTSQRELANLDPELVSKTELLEREIITVPESVSNSLLISATPRYYEEILRMVEKLDQAPAQVVIQALLVEVELQNTDEFGVELGFQDSILFDRSLTSLANLTRINETIFDPGTGFTSQQETIISQEAEPGFLFNSTGPLGNNINVNPSSIGTQGLGNFSLGRVNGDLGFGGLVLSASSESISVLLRALSAQRTVHILSRPQIRTLDNQEATIHVGQQVPIVDGVITSENFANPDIRQQRVGIALTVIPRISPDGAIVMRTEAVKSELAGAGVPIFFDAVNNRAIESPILNITEALATVSVPDGQTVVMGGMITKSDNTVERKVPWLGELPIVKHAFRYDSTTTRRTELLIFLTPRVINNSADSELIKQVEAERIHFIQEEAEMIHGPLYGIPSALVDPAVDGQLAPADESNISPTKPPLPLDDADVPTTVVPQKMQFFRLLDEDKAAGPKLERATSEPALEQIDLLENAGQTTTDRNSPSSLRERIQTNPN